VAWHAGEGKRPPALVSPDVVKKLHTPVIGTGVRENAPPGTPKTGAIPVGCAWRVVLQISSCRDYDANFLGCP